MADSIGPLQFSLKYPPETKVKAGVITGKVAVVQTETEEFDGGRETTVYLLNPYFTLKCVNEERKERPGSFFCYAQESPKKGLSALESQALDILKEGAAEINYSAHCIPAKGPAICEIIDANNAKLEKSIQIRGLIHEIQSKMLDVDGNFSGGTDPIHRVIW